MKRILSIFAVVAMLASLFCVNVSAAVPTTTGGEWSVLVSDNFDGEKATYFTKITGDTANVTTVFEAEDSQNKVIDLKMGTATINDVEVPYDGARIGVSNYTGNILGGSGENTIYMPNSTIMIEFDMCGKTMTSPFHVGLRVNGGKGSSVKINPNNIDADTWYTFRICVDRVADTDNFTIDNTTVYRKLRGSDEPFVKIEGAATASWSDTTTLDYGIGASPADSMIMFGVTAHNSYIRPFLGETTENSKTQTKTTGTSNGTATHSNYVASMADAHYQVDNITVSAKSTETNYELSKGIIKYWNMQDDMPASDYLTAYAEDYDDAYAKFATGITEETYTTGVDYYAQFAAGVDLPETFVLSFDANNASLGSSLDVEIYGDCYDESNSKVGAIPKRMVYLRSHAGILNKWYSYKVVCSGATPIEDQTKTVSISVDAVYRKERGSSADYTLLAGKAWAGRDALDNDLDYGIGSTMGGNGNHSNINSVKFGDCRRSWLGANTTGIGGTVDTVAEAKNQANGVWYIDNVMITDATAVTGDFAVAESVLSADVNLSTATATSAPVLAVYDGGRLVDVDFDALSHTGSAALAVDYDTTALTAPSAQFLVWENIGGAPLVEEIDIASYIAE